MRIFLNSDGSGPGGPERWAGRFIRELRRRGYEVTHDPASRFDAAYLSIAAGEAERFLERGIPFAYRVAGCCIPEWFEAMGKEMTEEHHRQNECIRQALRISPRVIYQSRWAKAQLDRVLYKREREYAIIHNGVSCREFHPSDRENKELVIASGGNLRYRYRLATLLEVSRMLEAPHSVVIAGPLDGECREVLDEYTKDTSVARRVRYLGELSEGEWAGALRGCDVLFHPVCGDWCPNVVVEALMSGVAIVTPRFGGTSELIGKGGIAFECEPWGYEAPSFAANALAAIKHVAENLADYKRCARVWAEECLTVEAMTDRYLAELDLPRRVPVRTSGWGLAKSRLRAFLKSRSKESGRLTIGYSFVDLAFGGAQMFLVDLIERFAARGHEAKYHLFADQGNPTLCDERLYSRINGVAKPVSVKDVLSCDVIHLDGYHSSAHKEYFSSVLGKCIETYHSEYSFEVSGPNHVANRVAVSRTLQECLPLGCDLIYQGIDTGGFAPVNGTKEYDLAIVGRIHPAKNHLLFLDICSLMARERPLKAAIIGGYPRDDDYAREVRGRISGLRGEGVEVEVTGFVENSRVSSYLNRSRVVLVTSPSEGFGRMAAEALACEVPVVASRVGGLTEIVEHGVNGFFARYNDVEDFARWALLLLNDEPLRRTMGGQGRRDVMRKFSVAEMVDKYESLYRGIMKKYCDRRLRQRRV